MKNILSTDIETLYKLEQQLVVTCNNHKYNVILQSHGFADCKLSCFEANLWFRTSHGMKYKKYKNTRGLVKAIKNAFKRYLGNIPVSNTQLTFELQNEIVTI